MAARLVGRGRGAATATLCVVTAALFVYSTLETMLSPALLVIQREVGSSTNAIAWVFTGLLLSGAVSTPLVGRMADVWDKRRVLLWVLAIVSFGTLLSAIATNIVVLTAGQVLQGIGLSLVPLSVGIIRDTQPAQRVAAGNGLIIGTAASSTAVGLLIVGPILNVLPYGYLFWIPFVVLVASFVVAWVVVPSCPPSKAGRIDWPGAALLAVGLALVLVGISRSSVSGWTSPLVLSLILVGLVVLAVFVAVELRVSDPMVDLRLLSQRAVMLTCIVSFAVGFGITAGFVLVPEIVQSPTSTGYGLAGSVLDTGLFLLPLGIVGTGVAPLTGWLERLITARGVMIVSSCTMVGYALVLLAAPGHAWVLLIATALLGLTVGLGLTCVMNLVVATVPEDRTASVSGLSFVVKNIAGTLGGQIGAVLLSRSTIAGTGLPAWSGFRWTFLLAAAISVVAILFSVALPRRLSHSTTPAAPAAAETV